MNEIVKFESDAGALVEITPQDVKQYLCSEASDKDIAMFLQLCKAQRLNPWIKEAYLVGFRDKQGRFNASIITGKEAFTKRANANPNFEGMEHGVVFMRKTPQGMIVDRREGAAVYKAVGETLLGGWARVYVKGKKPVYAELALDEYDTGRSNWAKMKNVMINKCAQVAALRLAFPSDFAGLYSAEEMGRAGEVAQTMEDAPAPIPAQQEPLQAEIIEMISDAQNDELEAKCHQFAEMRGKQNIGDVYDALLNSATMKAAGAILGEMLTYDQAALAIKLLDAWIEKAQAAQIAQGFDDAQQPAPSALDQAMERAHAAIKGNDLADEDIAF